MTREEICNKICMLKCVLTSHASNIGDWKIAKYQEYVLNGLDAPYDIVELYQKRQAVRDEINELQAQLDAMEAEGTAEILVWR